MQDDLSPSYFRSSNADSYKSPRSQKSFGFCFEPMRTSDTSQCLSRPSLDSLNRTSLEAMKNSRIKLPNEIRDRFRDSQNSCNYENQSSLRTSFESSKEGEERRSSEMKQITISMRDSELDPGLIFNNILNEEENHQQRISNGSMDIEISMRHYSKMDSAETLRGVVIDPASNYVGEDCKPFEVASIDESKEETKINTNNMQVEAQPKKEKKVNTCCNCKKSGCLTLHCACFQVQQFCEGCNCLECRNLEAYEDERTKALVRIATKNPDGLNRRMVINEELNNDKKGLEFETGCNCSKSRCKMSYCECYKFGVICGSSCTCQDCKNNKPTKNKARKH